MRDSLEISSPSQRQCVAIVILLALLIAVPTAITLTTVKVAGELVIPSANPTPYGYTVSLLLWIIPIVVIALWLIPKEHLKVPRRAFWISMAVLFPLGCALDFFFAHLFFYFPNKGATLGIIAPAFGGGVPIEEYIFYLTAPMVTLLLYIWFDEYWLRAYHEAVRMPDKLIKLHWGALTTGIILVVAGILIKKASGTPGFPGYFTFTVLMAFVPASLLLPAARANTNWRAFSVTLLFTVLVALMWEVSLAARYGWWLYQHHQMLGFFINGWSGLPVEEPLVWVSLTVATVICFQTAKVFLLRFAGRTHAIETGVVPATASGR